MFLPTHYLYERPVTPVVYDTPPVITRRRPLLLRALVALHAARPQRDRATLECVCADELRASSEAASS